MHYSQYVQDNTNLPGCIPYHDPDQWYPLTPQVSYTCQKGSVSCRLCIVHQPILDDMCLITRCLYAICMPPSVRPMLHCLTVTANSHSCKCPRQYNATRHCSQDWNAPCCFCWIIPVLTRGRCRVMEGLAVKAHRRHPLAVWPHETICWIMFMEVRHAFTYSLSACTTS